MLLIVCICTCVHSRVFAGTAEVDYLPLCEHVSLISESQQYPSCIMCIESYVNRKSKLDIHNEKEYFKI